MQHAIYTCSSLLILLSIITENDSNFRDFFCYILLYFRTLLVLFTFLPRKSSYIAMSTSHDQVWWSDGHVIVGVMEDGHVMVGVMEDGHVINEVAYCTEGRARIGSVSWTSRGWHLQLEIRPRASRIVWSTGVHCGTHCGSALPMGANEVRLKANTQPRQDGTALYLFCNASLVSI